MSTRVRIRRRADARAETAAPRALAEKKTSLHIPREAVRMCLNRNTKRGDAVRPLAKYRLFLETSHISLDDCLVAQQTDASEGGADDFGLLSSRTMSCFRAYFSVFPQTRHIIAFLAHGVNAASEDIPSCFCAKRRVPA